MFEISSNWTGKGIENQYVDTRNKEEILKKRENLDKAELIL